MQARPRYDNEANLPSRRTITGDEKVKHSENNWGAAVFHSSSNAVIVLTLSLEITVEEEPKDKLHCADDSGALPAGLQYAYEALPPVQTTVRRNPSVVFLFWLSTLLFRRRRSTMRPR